MFFYFILIQSSRVTPRPCPPDIPYNLFCFSSLSSNLRRPLKTVVCRGPGFGEAQGCEVCVLRHSVSTHPTANAGMKHSDTALTRAAWLVAKMSCFLIISSSPVSALPWHYPYFNKGIALLSLNIHREVWPVALFSKAPALFLSYGMASDLLLYPNLFTEHRYKHLPTSFLMKLC